MAPTDDLAPFGALVESTPLVGLGESVHTSGGYLDLKARLIRYLVAEKGFRVVAMETPRTQARKVGAYVATCQGTPEDALKGIFGVFASVGTGDLVKWMCEYNQMHPNDPVQFVGFDAQQPWDDVPELKDFLTKAAPADADGLLSALAKCDGYGFASATDYYTSGAFNKAYADADLQSCTAGLDALDAYLNSNAAALAAATSADALAWARLDSTSIRSWQGEKYYFNTDYQKSYESRDTAMAAILEQTRTLLFPKAKAVVWAHNYHLSQNHPEVNDENFGPWVTMGTILEKDLGDAYKAFGLIGYDVEINWPGVGMGSTDPPSKTALETQLHGLMRDALFVDLTSPDLASFVIPDKEYPVGNPQVATMIPVHQFHGLFYLEHSPPMDALYW
jgi:erythromycin esterase